MASLYRINAAVRIYPARFDPFLVILGDIPKKGWGIQGFHSAFCIPGSQKRLCRGFFPDFQGGGQWDGAPKIMTSSGTWIRMDEVEVESDSTENKVICGIFRYSWDDSYHSCVAATYLWGGPLTRNNLKGGSYDLDQNDYKTGVDIRPDRRHLSQNLHLTQWSNIQGGEKGDKIGQQLSFPELSVWESEQMIDWGKAIREVKAGLVWDTSLLYI